MDEYIAKTDEISIKKDDIFTEGFRDIYRKCGFTEPEINRIQQDTIYGRKQWALAKKNSDNREITSHAYIIAHKEMTKNVSAWFSGGKNG